MNSKKVILVLLVVLFFLSTEISDKYIEEQKNLKAQVKK